MSETCIRVPVHLDENLKKAVLTVWHWQLFIDLFLGRKIILNVSVTPPSYHRQKPLTLVSVCSNLSTHKATPLAIQCLIQAVCFFVVVTLLTIGVIS